MRTPSFVDDCSRMTLKFPGRRKLSMNAFSDPQPFIKERISVREQIYYYLRKTILNGELEAGGMFSDGEVAQLFGVSRTPVREAVQKLEAEGLVDRLPQKGNRVLGLAFADVAHVYSIRKALEGLAVRYAVRNITERELERMKSILDRAEAHIAEDSPEDLPGNLGKCVLDFNTLLFEACRVPKLADLIWQQREILGPLRILQGLIDKDLGQRFELRRRLYRALVRKDEKEALRAWEKHLETSFRYWLEKCGAEKQKTLLADFI